MSRRWQDRPESLCAACRAERQERRTKGSGGQHRRAEEFVGERFKEDFFKVFAQGEISNPGGSAFMTATTVAMHLEREPIETVSRVLQVATTVEPIRGRGED